MRNRVEDRVTEDGVTVDKDLPKSEFELGPLAVAIMAYQLWELRGCPYGSPDDDWFEAERRMKAVPEQVANGTGPREN
jgi:hypothetical protein